MYLWKEALVGAILILIFYSMMKASARIINWENEIIESEYGTIKDAVREDTYCCICHKILDINQTQRVVNVGDNVQLACYQHTTQEIVKFLKEISPDCEWCKYLVANTCIRLDGNDGKARCKFYERIKGW